MPADIDPQAQTAYMNRQTDKVIDKIMEMEPKSAHPPSGHQLEQDPLGPSHPSKRSHLQANPDLDDNVMKRGRPGYSDLSEAAV